MSLYLSYIDLYLFANPTSRLYFSMFFFLFQYIPHLFIVPRSLSISLYLFVNPNSRLSLSIPFSLSLPIFRIPTYICFYLFSIHLYFFISLCQSSLMPISFSLIVNPNSRLYLSNPFSLSHSILCISTYICFYPFSIHLYLFISLLQSKLMHISSNPILNKEFVPFKFFFFEII